MDFIRNDHNKVLPIEVKAGKSGRIKSLLKFMEDKKSHVTEAVRFDLAYRDHLKEGVSYNFPEGARPERLSFTLYNLPLYLVETLERET